MSPYCFRNNFNVAKWAMSQYRIHLLNQAALFMIGKLEDAYKADFLGTIEDVIVAISTFRAPDEP